MRGQKQSPDTVAKIIDGQWTDIQKRYNRYQIRILDAVRRCRTPSLGGHLYICGSCGEKHYRYHSCRNRHCPQCQNTDKERWIMARSQQLIEVPYYHIVFTLPHHLNELCLVYPKQMYGLLFQVAWNTLNEFGWNYKYLGAQIGATMVLHTWGSNMSFHPHVHCVVPGGGITLKSKWKEANGKGKFLFPVKAMSRVFRARFVKTLQALAQQHGLDNIDLLLDKLFAKPWIVYAKPPFGGPDAVIKYLAQYTHKVAITHHRIIKWDALKVTFSYTDYRHANQHKAMTLATDEFIRRLVQHFLPKSFPRIRHYGILSSAWKKRVFPKAKTIKINYKELWRSKGLVIDLCPSCKKGQLVYLCDIAPVRGPPGYNSHRYKTQTS